MIKKILFFPVKILSMGYTGLLYLCASIITLSIIVLPIMWLVDKF